MKLLFISILLFPLALFAGKYGEHREIGNRGFNLAMQKLISSRALGDSLKVLKFFEENLGITYDTIANKYVIPYLKIGKGVDRKYYLLFAEAQTSGGLLATIRPDQADTLVKTLIEHGDTETAVIGYVEQLDDPSVLLELI